jgi:D-lactate dehydrogenase
LDKQVKHIIRELGSQGYTSKVYSDPLYTLVKGTDAGIYRLIPKLVVQVNNDQEVIMVLEACRKAGVSVTFKGGGTSLCGQTVTDSVLMETGPGFKKYSINSDGSEIKVQPGLTGGFTNALLAGFHKKIGPSPASIASAKIGGIIANNASGASYGIATNSYNTLKGLKVIFNDGSSLDSLNVLSREKFRKAHPFMINSLQEISGQIKNNEKLASKIRHKYELKNTTGYGLNSLLDFVDPVDMLWHLMIGSEGTLGFISEATFKTVDSFPYSAAALVFLPDIREACKAIVPLRECGVSAAELMDRNALRSVKNPGIPALTKAMDEQTVALLIDTSAPDNETLNRQVEEIGKIFKSFRTVHPVEFIRDAGGYNRIWKVRKGLFTAAAATRPRGTSCLIEDVAFRAEVLGEAVVALRKLISDFRYEGSVMWGHLLDGNVHFVIMPDFRDTAEIDKYRSFMEQFVELTVNRFDGSLKAEHGTGRNMAPFVREEWGQELYYFMQRIKKAIDPQAMLNPGVILNNDPLIHLSNLKPIPVIDEIIDKCIECGFCENDCPSKNLTLTPRQRIVAYRETHGTNDLHLRRKVLKSLRRAFRYHGDETCATDGLCAIACPVEINTGNLIKELRMHSHGKLANKIATFISNHMAGATGFVRLVLNMVRPFHMVFRNYAMTAITGGIRRLSANTLPFWNPYMPGGANKKILKHISPETDLKVVYFPSCINRSMGKSADYGKEPELVKKTIMLLEKAGYQVVIPENADKLCCGMAFDSKGFKEQGLKKTGEMEQALLKASEGGRYPIFCEMSPCLLRMKETLSSQLRLYEPVEFILTYMTSKLTFNKIPEKIAIHATCSTTKMGLNEQLIRLASLCCEEVVVPQEIGCCGWAGDRGFTRPELNASALAELKSKLPPGVKRGFSTSRTCEIGLSLHSGISYKSVVYLVDEATQKI